jgi:hypothetical protein
VRIKLVELRGETAGDVKHERRAEDGRAAVHRFGSALQRATDRQALRHTTTGQAAPQRIDDSGRSAKSAARRRAEAKLQAL